VGDRPDQGAPNVTRRDALSMLAAAAIGGNAEFADPMLCPSKVMPLEG
jgi:hypothetical protein